MTALGLPVPPGFTISTEVCEMYYEQGTKFPESVKPLVTAALKKLEAEMTIRAGNIVWDLNGLAATDINK